MQPAIPEWPEKEWVWRRRVEGDPDKAVYLVTYAAEEPAARLTADLTSFYFARQHGYI